MISTTTIATSLMNGLARAAKRLAIHTATTAASTTTKFSVVAPAMQPQSGPPTPDATTEYSGSGKFLTTNTKIKAG